MDYTLTFKIQSYWHIGSGQEAAAYADALTLKDVNQLPYLPGKSIKGLLREAFQTGIDNQWFQNETISGNKLLDSLFGSEGANGEYTQGLLQITNATLSDAEKNYLTKKDNKNALAQLYKVTFSTAIHEDTGVAKNTSLRSTEVTIPMTLQASMSLNTTNITEENKENVLTLQEHLLTWLDNTVCLITELGAKRHRGLGKVIVTATAKE